MATGKKAASAAGKTLNSSKATKGEKRVAASDLAQAKHISGSYLSQKAVTKHANITQKQADSAVSR